MPPKKTTRAAAAAPKKARTVALTPLSPAPRLPVPFLLGDVLRCTITDFHGVAVAFSEYLYGCRRWALQTGLDKDGNPSEWRWFDEPQLARVSSTGQEAAAPAVTGGPRPDSPAR